jgi:biotin carboxyl carrier protein
MRIDVEIGGRGRTVTVERLAAGRFQVAVDGQSYTVDAVVTGEFGLSLVLEQAGRASREVHVTPGPLRGGVLVSLDGCTVPATVNGRRTRRGGRDGAGNTTGEQAIVAPMPGRVVRVLVAPGDEVAASQGVVVVEAMKMENELRTPRAGRVKEIAVTPGTSVEAGRVLVVVG